MPTPVSYSLKFAIGGNADPDIYTDLDEARDVAFGVAEELGVDVHITEHHGEAKNVIEIIEGFEGDPPKSFTISLINHRKMKTIDISSPEAVALNAAIRLYLLLTPDENFPAYNGTKAAFDNLYRELFVIARDEVSLEVDPVGMVVQTWYDYQQEIQFGARKADWFLTGVV